MLNNLKKVGYPQSIDKIILTDGVLNNRISVTIG